jgi:tetratricopeptide (TPR) repeat protein
MRRRLFTIGRVVAVSALLGAAGCASTNPLKKGREAAAAGDDARAEEFFREAIQKGKGADEAKRRLETLLMKRAAAHASDEPEDAIMAYREIIGINPESVQARVALGRLLMRKKRYEDALEVLSEVKGCAGCRSLASVVFEKRAMDRINAGEFDGASADLEAAFELRPDARLVLGKIRIYTVGGAGSSADAVALLRQAQKMIDVEHAAQVKAFVDTRRELAVAAARNGDGAAIEATLQVASPEYQVDPRRALMNEYYLRLSVASTQIAHGAEQEGMRRGAEAYAEALESNDDEIHGYVRSGFLDLFAQRGAQDIAAGSRGAARGIRAGLRIDPDHLVLRYQLVIATSIRSSSQARSVLADIPEDAPGRDKLEALLLTVRARKMVKIGQMTAARRAVERASELAPDMLEVRLATAEILSRTRMKGLSRTAIEEFRRIGAFHYPRGRINCYGGALAELDWIRERYDERAASHPLRGPRFASVFEALEGKIRSFYPFDVVHNPDPTAVLTLRGKQTEPVEVRVTRPSQDAKTLAVPPAGDVSMSFDDPGFVHLFAPARELGLFVEPHADIIAEI